MSLIQEKIAQAKSIVQELDVDCWLTFVRETALNGDPTLAYLIESGLTWHSALIVTRREAIAIVGAYDKAAIADLRAYDRIEGYVKDFREPLQRVLQAIQPKAIAVNYSVGSEVCDGLTHGMFLALAETLQPIGMANRLVSAEGIISALRQRKTPREIAAMKEAIRLTLQIYDEVRKEIRPGTTEKVLADFMARRVKELGVDPAWDAATCPSVFTGPDTAGAHYGPTDRVVQEGHVLNMDFGVRVDGYCSDLQRTFYVKRAGETEAPESVRKGFATIRKSVEDGRKAMRPGVQGLLADTASRKAVTDAGYEEFPHAVGHQVGRFAHDGTALLGPLWEKYTTKPLQLLEEGMVFTIEPRLMVPGYGVVTIEEMVQVTSTGAEYISAPQTELYLV